jgi:hypothetical protein
MRVWSCGPTLLVLCFCNLILQHMGDNWNMGPVLSFCQRATCRSDPMHMKRSPSYPSDPELLLLGQKYYWLEPSLGVAHTTLSRCCCGLHSPFKISMLSCLLLL